ncbi:MAG: hypothetical protein K0S71_1067 [Clostridia bacterium]|jgi:hypothetical protein|nr:hypothetical protein [Clostridia bacterium]
MRKMISTALVLATFMFIGLVNVPAIEAVAPIAPYTILVYMVGSDLESDSGAATNDLIEMAAVGGAKNVNVVVETGGAKKWHLPMISNKVNQRWLVQ